MKKTFTIFKITFFSLFAFTTVFAQQNLFTTTPVYYAGFENNPAMWYSAAINGLAAEVSMEKPFQGLQSTKIFTANPAASGGVGFITNIVGGVGAYEPANVKNVASGLYTFNFKIWIENAAPTQIIFYFNEAASGLTAGDFKELTVSLVGLDAKKWHTVSSELILPKAYTAMKYALRVKNSDFGSLSTPSTIYIDNLELYKGNVTSTNNVNLLNVSVYPNPATTILNVNTEQVSNVNIYNLSGVKVYSNENVNPGVLRINTGEFAKGIYILNVAAGDKTSVQKIIIE